MRKNYIVLLMIVLCYACTPTEQSTTGNDSVSEKTKVDNNQPTQAKTEVPEYEAYYSGLEELDGEALAKGLYQKIKGHKTFTYRQCYDILMELDQDPDNSNNVIGIYSNFSMDAAKQYDDGNGWNREHIWAKSYGDFGTSPGPGTDLHHLRASDVSTNSARNNRTFDEADEPYTDGDGRYQGESGCYTSSVEWVWEPRNERKGDIARMIFYMDVRYEGENGEPDLALVDEIINRGSKEPYHGKLSTLLRWHEEDPVSEEEKQRNELIYEKYQKNRNPFIDHPEFARMVWGYDF
ncbi:endonuclease I family protein [Chondrinema litorale]|uniref:endonuclease I family protein n=1 Tax=Chondrinema litorale TaxID=2994555 RepID=UPI0025427156|nr:endonuclease [Chondrinema litorale]UZR92272.1 endonuclease [Chondrinema litorale]